MVTVPTVVDALREALPVNTAVSAEVGTEEVSQLRAVFQSLSTLPVHVTVAADTFAEPIRIERRRRRYMGKGYLRMNWVQRNLPEAKKSDSPVNRRVKVP